MNKKIISILIVLMSITLIGIIVIQSLWIKNAINVKEKQFDMAVYDALNNVVNKLEKEETLFLVKNSFGKDSIDSAICEQIMVKTKIINEKDSNEIVVFNTKNKSAASVDLKIEDSCSSIISISSDDHLSFTGDSIIMKKFSTEQDSLKIMIEEIIDDKNKKVNIILSEIMHELEYRDQPVEKRLDIKYLNQLLIKELQEKEIETDFSFMIRSNGKIIKDTLSNINFDLSEAYPVSLFSDDVIKNEDTLFLFFPEKNSHIIKNMAYMLSGSLLFTVFILIIFIISIRTILKQKKISEIKSDFINNMTHEFKTPIATISLATDSIENPKILADKEKILYFTKVIREENQRMNNQVENVLQIALSEKKEISFNISQYNAHEIIQTAIKSIELQIQQKNGKIQTQLLADKIIVNVDKMHFTNVIYNLLDNACKYSKSDPKVVISSSNENGYLCISVKDNGIGMSKEVQGKIFEKFYRESTGNVHNVKGHGLGLSYAKAIIESFNGKIIVKSEVNIGSIFTIKLPLK